MRRLLHLLYWQAQFDPRRPMMWLVGAIYLLMAGPLTLGSFHLVNWRTGLPTSGSAYLSALTLLNAVAGVLFATSQASRAADERATGFLAAVQMTDIPPWVLTAFRGLGILVSGAPLWLIRLPLYVWCYHLGGVRLSDFVAAECVAWVATAFAGGVAILCSQFGRSAQTAMMMIGGVLVASQALFLLPRVLMRMLRLAVGQAPSSLDAPNEWATAFSQWGLVGHVWNRPSVDAGWSAAMPALVLHLVVAGTALVASWRLAYFNVLPDDSPRGTLQRKGPPRRVSGDALVWQAVHIHHYRGKFRLAAVSFDLALLAALFISIFSLPPIGVGLLGLAIAFRALTTAAMRAGVCVAYEIRDQTLSTLALLPREPLEFFRSWRRGGTLASRMEYFSAAVGAAAVVLTMGEPAAGLVGVMVAMLLAAPFGYLNSLCRFEWAVFWLALWLFPLGMLFLAVSIAAGAVTSNAWVGLVVFSVLAVIFHQILVRQIPYYFRRAVERG